MYYFYKCSSTVQHSSCCDSKHIKLLIYDQYLLRQDYGFQKLSKNILHFNDFSAGVAKDPQKAITISDTKMLTYYADKIKCLAYSFKEPSLFLL